MAAKVLIVTLVIAATLSLGEALRCHGCTGSKLSDCHENYQPSIIDQECSAFDYSNTVMSRFIPLNTKNYAQKIEARCVAFYIEDDGFVQDASAKGCSYAIDGVEPCDTIGEKGSPCYSCNEDYCNI